MTITRIPIRTVYDGANNPVGLAEFQIGEVVPIGSGGTSANTIEQARINLVVDDANIRALFSVSGGGSYNSSTGVISIDATDLSPFAKLVDLTTANVAEVTNLYYTNDRADARVGPAFNAANIANEGVGINAGAISSLQGVTLSQATAITNAHDQANVATVNASSAYNQANIATTFSQSAYDQANVATVNASSAYNQANTATTFAQSAYDQANIATTFSQSAYDQANVATVNASSAFDAANTKAVPADLTTANVLEVTNLYFTNQRAFANLLSASTTSLQEGDNLYFTNTRAVAALSGQTVSMGEATITGNLFVLGNVVEFNTETLTVQDKNIVLANGSPTAAASDGAGITVDGAGATIVYNSDEDGWDFNKKVKVTGDIDSTGRITSPFFYSESDIALKEDITPISNPLKKVLKLFGVSFNWKSNKQKSLGVIAQDVEKIIPEIVTSDRGGYKKVSYDSLIPLLIEAIKEQQKQIDDLRKKIK